MTNGENGAWEESISGWEEGARPPTDAGLDRLQLIAQSAGRRCVVGALIRNRDGCVFVHRRSQQRRTWPGCWDIVGGHVEEGESLRAALAREISEETGWTLTDIVDLLAVTDWRSGAGEEPRREFDFLVEVDGDLSRPRLEPEKHTEYRWLRADETAIMKEERASDDAWLIRVVELALHA
jgi:8-oxo-dGTP pyrophosphatase MutT (NUDIX family)